ncbi:MAG: tetratricopeptide repeat protein [Bacteroidetes bacterium]|nr:MAG: tetratricopeptide repeat protein [Bacteroidota bacterium]
MGGRQASYLLFILIFAGISILPALGGETIGNLESRVESSQNDSLKIELLLLMGDHFEHTDKNSALHFYNQALNLAEFRFNNSTSESDKEIYKGLQIKAFRYIAYLHKIWGDYQDAYDDYDKILKYYTEIGDSENIIIMLLRKFNIQYYQGLYPEALKHLNEALFIAESNEDFVSDKAVINVNLGNVYFNMGDYIKSLTHYQNALDIYESINSMKNRGAIHLGFGNIHNELGNFNRAMQEYELALKEYENVEDNNALSNIHSSIGSLYFDYQDFENAEYHFNKALNYARLLKNDRMLAHSFLNLGILATLTDDYRMALEQYQMGLEYAREGQSFHIISLMLRNMALAYSRLEEHEKGLEMVLESLDIAQRIESIDAQAQANRVAAEILQIQGQYADALRYYQIYKVLSDSLLDIEKQKQLNEISAIHESENQKQAIELQQLELERNQIELRQKSQLINTFIVAIAFIVIIGIILFSFNNRRLRSHNQIGKQLRVIENNKKKISELITQSYKQNERIFSLEKQIASWEKNNRQELSFAEEVTKILHPGTEVLPSAFNGNAFHYFLKENKNGSSGFLWIKQLVDEIIIVKAGCNLPGIKGNFINLYITSLLDKFSNDKYINQPSLLTENLYQQITHFSQKMDIGQNSIFLSFLWINKDNHNIIFSGKQIPLYLAIARNPKNVTAQKSFDYQEIQKLKTEEPDQTDKPGIHSPYLHRIQLKKTDRLYLIAQCSRQNNNSDFSSVSFLEEELIHILNNNQEMNLNQQPEVINNILQSQKNKIKTPDYLSIAGIEL